MGVKGLMKFLQKKNIFPEEEILSSPRITLLIDGSGWMFHLFRKTQTPMVDGGYLSFREAIVQEVHNLMGLGFNLAVYFDGPRCRFKAKTKEKRRQEREDEWIYLCELISRHEQTCHGKPFMSLEDGAAANNLPLPLLTSEQFKLTISSLAVSVITCEEEADIQLARDCSTMNKKGTDGQLMAIVYANDSDFILTKDVPYVHFDSPFVLTSKGLLCQIWWRSNVANALSLSEDNLIEFGLAIGNDFTGPYVTEFSNIDLCSLGHGKKGSVEFVHKVYCFFREQTCDFQLDTANPELLLAVKFSRALYNLRSLSQFPFDSNVEAQDGFNILSDNIRSKLGQYISSCNVGKKRWGIKITYANWQLASFFSALILAIRLRNKIKAHH